MRGVDLILKVVYTSYKLKTVNTKIYTDPLNHAYAIVTEGTSGVHIRGVAKELYDLFKGLYGSSMSGSQGSSLWQVVSNSSFIVHIMKPEVRTFYSLDSLFNNEMNLKRQLFSRYS